ncbi:hypothetical protein [Marilutibacter maris]|uniref:hypothetical protein n=1 Tax=Marilutibacter maris TaxID=1605891 RepID=UPI0011AEB266|nr:hypothetical protein [Lysobacter maris]
MVGSYMGRFGFGENADCTGPAAFKPARPASRAETDFLNRAPPLPLLLIPTFDLKIKGFRLRRVPFVLAKGTKTARS